MPSKLRNVKIEVDGITFGSKREAKRYLVLKDLRDKGEITDLRLQVKYSLIPKQRDSQGKAIRAIEYVADFVYDKDGEQVVEDSKGYRNPSSASYKVFVMKKKMMRYFYGIDVIEV